MTHTYVAVQWNRQKRRYDLAVLVALLSTLGAFVALGKWVRPHATAETLLIRGTAVSAWALLHLILSLGPLSRLDSRWLILLYNRRHLGVTFFLVCSAHAALSLMQFHGFGDMNPLLSLLSSNGRFTSLTNHPFQLLGAGAWIIFLFMAVTSHDFWLAHLTAPVWKALHMGIYLAYALVLGHVALGSGQSQSGVVLAMAGGGALWILSLHSLAALREHQVDRRARGQQNRDGWIEVPSPQDIVEGRARLVEVAGERVAVYRRGEEYWALSNVCQHQNGPLGEGCILEGKVTCPWHGFQYDPTTGAAPPPYTERVPTFDLRWEGHRLYLSTVARPAPSLSTTGGR